MATRVKSIAEERADAYREMMEAGEKISRVIVRQRSGQSTVPMVVIAKLIEAQQALFAAQRLFEGSI